VILYSELWVCLFGPEGEPVMSWGCLEVNKQTGYMSGGWWWGLKVRVETSLLLLLLLLCPQLAF